MKPKTAHRSRRQVLALGAILVLVCTSSGAGGPPPAPPSPPPELPIRDCNGNGIDDAIDIALGTSSDVDFDGVPDECQDPPPDLRNPAGPGTVPPEARGSF